MRAGVIAATGIVASCVGVTARAEPLLDASGFVGVRYFGDDSDLGDATAPEQVPGTAPVIGGRVGWTALPALVGDGAVRLQLGIEGELSITPATTGSVAGVRPSYVAPVFGWNAHAILRLAGPRFRPHLVIGGGGETVASASPFMTKETDAIAYWGPGASLDVSDRWTLRIDGRHGLMPGRAESITSTFALHVGLSATFGMPARKVTTPPDAEPEPSPVAVSPVAVSDADGDGIPDGLDRCPRERETINSVEDSDGCPEADPDGDAIVGAADGCPTEAEDVDGFADTDGCPDPDNDGDGIADARDTCPIAPETRNGITDTDGCPDTIPGDVTRTFDGAAAIQFERTRARVTAAGKTVLQRVVTLLLARRDLRILVVGHPEVAGDDDLAKRRADAVKWHLIDQGVMADRVETVVGGVGKPALTFTLATR